MAKRKIGFYYLLLKENIDGTEVVYSVEESLNKLFPFMLSLEPVARKQDLYNDKFVFIDNYSVSVSSDSCRLTEFLFKSAKHSYRAPLLNRNTVEARDNPKTMAEGEQMKTHGLIKYKDGDAICFLETGQNMLTCSNIVDYLNKSREIYNSNQTEEDNIIKGIYCFDMIARDDFREVLDSMSRVTLADVYIDKSILGSDVLNFSNPSEELQEQIVMSLKADRKKNIKQHIYDILDHLNGTESKIRRIRVKGKLPNDNESIIDTSFINKKEYVDAQQDEDTGEFNTPYMFTQLKLLSKDY